MVGWLLSLPFGKFFHIVQRPASIGVTLYQTVNQDVEHYGQQPQTGACRRCGRELPSQQFVDDLKATLGELGRTTTWAASGAGCRNTARPASGYCAARRTTQLMGRRFL